MSSISDLTLSFRDLLIHPAKLSIPRLWAAVPVRDREIALRFLLAESKHALAGTRICVAEARHFRRQTVDRWPVEKLAAVAAKIRLEPPELQSMAMVSLHLNTRSSMLARFLDHLGIAHENGLVEEADLLTPFASTDRVALAAADLLHNFPADHVVLYLMFLLTVNFDKYEPVALWLHEQASLIGEGRPSAADTTAEIDQRGKLDRSPTEVSGFTTLDRRLILAAVDNAAGIEGAPTEDELDDMVNELLQLNGRRHQTYFHAGYCDIILRRAIQQELPADNEQRRGWYWAGVICGLARENRQAEIVEHYDEERGVKILGRGAPVPADAAAALVFDALVKAGRHSEATAFLTPFAVGQSFPLRVQLLQAATALIREDRAAVARQMLELLWSEYEAAFTRGDDVATRFYLDLRRRSALCYRQLGEQSQARKLLESLSEEDDPIARANALTDLGLLAAGFRKLGELRIPSDQDEKASFVAALKTGEPRFIEAIGVPGHIPAHASFALGVLRLAQADAKGAVSLLENALVYFGTQSEVYSIDGTLPLCQLYLGLAQCLSLEDDPAKIPRASELIRSGLSGGALIPRNLVSETLDSLSLIRTEFALPTAEYILQSAGDQALDAVLQSAAPLNSPAIADALFRRVFSESRTLHERIADAYRALPLLLSQNHVQEAADTLDFLEEAAIEGVGSSEFITLLGDPKRISPAWSLEEIFWARVRLLEANADYITASAELSQRFHKVLSRADTLAIDEASDCVDRILSYGPPAANAAEELTPRLTAAQASNARHDQAPDAPTRDVCVLVVGGNERQRRVAQSIVEEMETHRVHVSFIHSGFAGDQSDNVEEFKRRLPRADGVVLMHLMRTNFGRTVRRLCGSTPWRGCGGTGKGAIIRSIYAVREQVLGGVAGGELR